MLNFVDFADWIYANNIDKGITISPVFRVEYLGVSALPPDLRTLALDRLNAGLDRYQQLEGTVANRCVEIISAAKAILDSTPYNQADMFKFVEHIRREDLVSNRPLSDVVPEWQPYFEN